MLRNLAALTVLAPTLWMISAQALGLGDIELRSRLNQRFLATIPVLSAGPEDLESLSVTLASDEVFARSGIDRSSFVSTLKFVLDVGGIKVSSDQVVRDPFVNFIVQARWNGGRFLREYTVLLDPPGEPSAAVADEVPSDVPDAAATALVDIDPDADPDGSSYELAAAAPAQADVVTAAPAETAGDDVYGPVLETQTLWSIAGELRPTSEVTIEQMVLALYQTNPQAFGGGSINRLLSGSSLNVPTAEQVTAVDAATAHSKVAALRGQPPTVVPPAASQARASTPAAVAAVVEPPAPAPVPAPALAEAVPAPAVTVEAAQPEAPPPSAASPVEPAVETSPVTASEPPSEPSPAPIAESPSAPSTFPFDDAGLPLMGGLLALILLLLLVVLKRRARPRPNPAKPLSPQAVWLSMPVVADAVPEIQRAKPAAAAEPEVVTPAPVVPPEPEPQVQAEPAPELLPLPEDRAAPVADAAFDHKLDAGDPLTEADFHLAYGLHDEAIQMLKTAIAEAPERADLQQKLAEVYAAAAAAKTPPAELSVVDFDLDADIARPEIRPGIGPETSPDILAAAALPPVVAAAPQPAAPRDADPLADIDLSSFDLGPASSAEPPLDPRLIEFSIDELEASTEPEPDHPLSASGDEIDTKLDLARAYADMGDIEAADKLLAEVTVSGSDAQKAEAEALKQHPKDAG